MPSTSIRIQAVRMPNSAENIVAAEQKASNRRVVNGMDDVWPIFNR